MRIEYVSSKSQRTVSDEIGNTLIARKLARRVYETRQVKVENVESIRYSDDEICQAFKVAEPAPEVEISERTGKPKRQYKRRDLTAEG